MRDRIVRFTQDGVSIATRSSRIGSVRPVLDLGPRYPKPDWARAEVIIHGNASPVDQDTEEAIRRWEVAEEGAMSAWRGKLARWLSMLKSRAVMS